MLDRSGMNVSAAEQLANGCGYSGGMGAEGTYTPPFAVITLLCITSHILWGGGKKKAHHSYQSALSFQRDLNLKWFDLSLVPKEQYYLA